MEPFLAVGCVGQPPGPRFGAYRYRVWNGSLGMQDVYSAYGVSLQSCRVIGLRQVGLSRCRRIGVLGVGNYQSNGFI